MGADAARDEKESSPCLLRIILPFKTLPCKGEKDAKFSFSGKFPIATALQKAIDEAADATGIALRRLLEGAGIAFELTFAKPGEFVRTLCVLNSKS
jgi:hypothetical protein